MDLFDNVRALKGVGETRAKQLSALGIETVYDLLSHFPRAYEDRSRFVTISELFAQKGVTPLKRRVYSNVLQKGDW